MFVCFSTLLFTLLTSSAFSTWNNDGAQQTSRSGSVEVNQRSKHSDTPRLSPGRSSGEKFSKQSEQTLSGDQEAPTSGTLEVGQRDFESESRFVPVLWASIHLIEILGCAVFGILLATRYRIVKRPYLLLWSLGWMFFGIYFTLLAIQGLTPAFPPHSIGWFAEMSAGLFAISCTGLCFVIGTAEIDRQEMLWKIRLRNGLLAVLLGLLIINVIASGLSIEGAVVVFGIGTMAWLTVCFILTTLNLKRISRQNQFNSSFLIAATFVLSLVYLEKGISLALVPWMGPETMAHGVYVMPFELLLGFCVGVEMMVWYIQDESRETELAKEAKHESEKKLLRTQKREAVGRLAGGIAHDFNNILTVIQVYSQMLLDESDPESEVGKSAVEISRAIDRASNLTNSLLAISRTSSDTNLEADAFEIVRDVIRVSERTIGEQIRISQVIGNGSCSVAIDAGELQQIILNLLLNAKEAMPSGGQISVRTEVTRDFCRISVDDQGTGMSPEEIAKIYQPFYTTKSDGTGLGLFMVADLLSRAGGAISVESTPGVGSTFEVRLPLTTPELQSPSPVSGIAQIWDADQKKNGNILVVEDDELIRELIEKVLIGAGHSVTLARSATEAFPNIKSDSQIDLILSDVMMPGMGGPDFIQRARDILGYTPALLMSGNDGQIAEILKESLCPVIRKPFKPGELLAAVHAEMSRKCLSKN